MAKVGYSNPVDGEEIARAIGRECKVSPKHCVEICRTIRGMKVENAKALLNSVIAMERPIRFRRYNRYTSHKRGYGPARYPVKACKAILRTIENAQANAEAHKKLDPESMRILTAAAHLGRKIQGWLPRAHGRTTQFDEQTVNIEIVLEAFEEE